MNQPSLITFVRSVADLLRCNYRQSGYGRAILPFTFPHATQQTVLAKQENRKKLGINPASSLLRASGDTFFNTSPLDINKLVGNQDHVRASLFNYFRLLSSSVQDAFNRSEFHGKGERHAKCGFLYLITKLFTQIDLQPKKGHQPPDDLVFEELSRKVTQLSNETASEYFPPVRSSGSWLISSSSRTMTPSPSRA